MMGTSHRRGGCPPPAWGVPSAEPRGFTLVEILVAAAVLILLLAALSGMVGQTSQVTRRASEKISAFQGARFACEMMTRILSQASLNTYWGYDNPNNPKRYRRESELHFLVGKAGAASLPGTAGTGDALFFQAPAGVSTNTTSHGGLEGLLNACGYYVEYGSEPIPEPFQDRVTPKYRYRLMQAIQPTESLSVYDKTGSGWVGNLTHSAQPLADNVVLLIVWPRKPLTEDAAGDALTLNYAYDSRLNASGAPQPATANQLPPLVQLTFVAIDEHTAARLCTGGTPPAQIAGASQGLFNASNQTAFESDLQTFESRLAVAGIEFQVFNAFVPIREFKME